MPWERDMNNLGGGYSLYFWIELIHELVSHIRDMGECCTIKNQRCVGVGAKGCVVASLKGVLFTLGGARPKPSDDIIYTMRQK